MKPSIGEKLGASTKGQLILVVVIFLLQIACTYNDISRKTDCANSTLKIANVKVTDESSCLLKNGQAEVSVTGGKIPYLYSTNDLPDQFSNIFSQLSAGRYSLRVKDRDGCADSASFTVANFASNLSAQSAATIDNLCFGGNGTIRIRPQNGEPPYKFSLQNQPTGSDSIFSSLNHGQYTISVVDALQCEYKLSVIVPRGSTGVSWLSSVKPIISSACSKSGCHVSGTNRVDLTKFENVKLYAGEIRARVISRSMPFDGRLPDDQIQLIACWVEDGANEN